MSPVWAADSTTTQNNSSTTTVTFQPPTANTDVASLLAGILKWMITIAIPIAVVMIIYAGFMFLANQGNPKMIERGKKILTWTVMGLAVVLIGGGFITLITSILNWAK